MRKLYFGGPIRTMEDEGPGPDAVLTEGGRIAALLTGEAAQEVTDAQPVDLAGRALLPGFIDAHSHFSGYAASLLQIDLDGCRSAEEVAARIAAWIGDNRPPAGQWLTAGGYDHNDLPGGRHITRWQLDEAAPEHPLLVKHKSGHLGVFNSRGLAALGIDDQSPCPPGGVMGRRSDGRLDGYMEEAALLAQLPRIPGPAPEAYMAAVDKAQDRYFSYGITSAQEGAVQGNLPALYQQLVENRRLRLSVTGYADPGSMAALRQALPQCVGGFSGNFRIGGYKIFLDGSPQGRTAWMRQPYLGGGGTYTGYGMMTEDAVFDAVARACREGVQILAHCNGDMACEQFLRAVERARKAGLDPAAVRPVMVHAQLLGADQMARVRDLGVVPSFFVAHVWHWGDVHMANFGKTRAENISPAGLAQAMGIPYTFHQDAPVIQPDMMETVWCAVNRRTRSGRVLGPSQAVGTYDALRAVTIRAAYQYFDEKERGSIAPGKAADLVVLDRDPLTAPAGQLRDIRVCRTIKDGQTVFQAE